MNKLEIAAFIKKQSLNPDMRTVAECVAVNNGRDVETTLRSIDSLAERAPTTPPFWFMPAYGPDYEEREFQAIPIQKAAIPEGKALTAQEFAEHQRGHALDIREAQHDARREWELERSLKWPYFWAATMKLGCFWGREDD